MTDAAPPPLEFMRLFTDGACKGNPGPGGWAFILKHPASGRALEGSGGEPHTTNNRMEMMAVIAGLRVLRLPLTLELYSDSRYVLDGLSKWMPSWRRRSWRTAEGDPVKNQDLWLELDRLLRPHSVSVHWVRGHAGHPENTRCDQLAASAARGHAGGR
jgi:ribonuclease HI